MISKRRMLQVVFLLLLTLPVTSYAALNLEVDIQGNPQQQDTPSARATNASPWVEVERVELSFPNGRPSQTVPVGQKGFYAIARFKYKGNGTFTIRWMVDGRVHSQSTEILTFGKEVTIRSDKSGQALPTFDHGEHSVTLSLINSRGATSFKIPTIKYFVAEGANAADIKGDINAIYPLSGGVVTPAEVEFRWRAKGKYAAYRLELERLPKEKDLSDQKSVSLSTYQKTGSDQVILAKVEKESYKTSARQKKKLSPGAYRWRVLGLNAKGKTLEKLNWIDIQIGAAVTSAPVRIAGLQTSFWDINKTVAKPALISTSIVNPLNSSKFIRQQATVRAGQNYGIDILLQNNSAEDKTGLSVEVSDSNGYRNIIPLDDVLAGQQRWYTVPVQSDSGLKNVSGQLAIRVMESGSLQDSAQLDLRIETYSALGAADFYQQSALTNTHYGLGSESGCLSLTAAQQNSIHEQKLAFSRVLSAESGSNQQDLYERGYFVFEKNQTVQFNAYLEDRGLADFLSQSYAACRAGIPIPGSVVRQAPTQFPLVFLAYPIDELGNTAGEPHVLGSINFSAGFAGSVQSANWQVPSAGQYRISLHDLGESADLYATLAGGLPKYIEAAGFRIGLQEQSLLAGSSLADLSGTAGAVWRDDIRRSNIPLQFSHIQLSPGKNPLYARLESGVIETDNSASLTINLQLKKAHSTTIVFLKRLTLSNSGATADFGFYMPSGFTRQGYLTEQPGEELSFDDVAVFNGGEFVAKHDFEESWQEQFVVGKQTGEKKATTSHFALSLNKAGLVLDASEHLNLLPEDSDEGLASDYTGVGLVGAYVALRVSKERSLFELAGESPAYIFGRAKWLGFASDGQFSGEDIRLVPVEDRRQFLSLTSASHLELQELSGFKLRFSAGRFALQDNKVSGLDLAGELFLPESYRASTISFDHFQRKFSPEGFGTEIISDNATRFDIGGFNYRPASVQLRMVEAASFLDQPVLTKGRVDSNAINKDTPPVLPEATNDQQSLDNWAQALSQSYLSQSGLHLLQGEMQLPWISASAPLGAPDEQILQSLMGGYSINGRYISLHPHAGAFVVNDTGVRGQWLESENPGYRQLGAFVGQIDQLYLQFEDGSLAQSQLAGKITVPYPSRIDLPFVGKVNAEGELAIAENGLQGPAGNSWLLNYWQVELLPGESDAQAPAKIAEPIAVSTLTINGAGKGASQLAPLSQYLMPSGYQLSFTGDSIRLHQAKMNLHVSDEFGGVEFKRGNGEPAFEVSLEIFPDGNIGWDGINGEAPPVSINSGLRFLGIPFEPEGSVEFSRYIATRSALTQSSSQSIQESDELVGGEQVLGLAIGQSSNNTAVNSSPLIKLAGKLRFGFLGEREIKIHHTRSGARVPYISSPTQGCRETMSAAGVDVPEWMAPENDLPPNVVCGDSKGNIRIAADVRFYNTYGKEHTSAALSGASQQLFLPDADEAVGHEAFKMFLGKGDVRILNTVSLVSLVEVGESPDGTRFEKFTVGTGANAFRAVLAGLNPTRTLGKVGGAAGDIVLGMEGVGEEVTYFVADVVGYVATLTQMLATDMCEGAGTATVEFGVGAAANAACAPFWEEFTRTAIGDGAQLLGSSFEIVMAVVRELISRGEISEQDAMWWLIGLDLSGTLSDAVGQLVNADKIDPQDIVVTLLSVADTSLKTIVETNQENPDVAIPVSIARVPIQVARPLVSQGDISQDEAWGIIASTTDLGTRVSKMPAIASQAPLLPFAMTMANRSVEVAQSFSGGKAEPEKLIGLTSSIMNLFCEVGAEQPEVAAQILQGIRETTGLQEQDAANLLGMSRLGFNRAEKLVGDSSASNIVNGFLLPVFDSLLDQSSGGDICSMVPRFDPVHEEVSSLLQLTRQGIRGVNELPKQNVDSLKWALDTVVSSLNTVNTLGSDAGVSIDERLVFTLQQVRDAAALVNPDDRVELQSLKFADAMMPVIEGNIEKAGAPYLINASIDVSREVLDGSIALLDGGANKPGAWIDSSVPVLDEIRDLPLGAPVNDALKILGNILQMARGPLDGKVPPVPVLLENAKIILASLREYHVAHLGEIPQVSLASINVGSAAMGYGRNNMAHLLPANYYFITADQADQQLSIVEAMINLLVALFNDGDLNMQTLGEFVAAVVPLLGNADDIADPLSALLTALPALDKHSELEESMQERLLTLLNRAEQQADDDETRLAIIQAKAVLMRDEVLRVGKQLLYDAHGKVVGVREVLENGVVRTLRYLPISGSDLVNISYRVEYPDYHASSGGKGGALEYYSSSELQAQLPELTITVDFENAQRQYNLAEQHREWLTINDQWQLILKQRHYSDADQNQVTYNAGNSINEQPSLVTIVEETDLIDFMPGRVLQLEGSDKPPAFGESVGDIDGSLQEMRWVSEVEFIGQTQKRYNTFKPKDKSLKIVWANSIHSKRAYESYLLEYEETPQNADAIINSVRITASYFAPHKKLSNSDFFLDYQQGRSEQRIWLFDKSVPSYEVLEDDFVNGNIPDTPNAQLYGIDLGSGYLSPGKYPGDKTVISRFSHLDTNYRLHTLKKGLLEVSACHWEWSEKEMGIQLEPLNPLGILPSGGFLARGNEEGVLTNGAGEPIEGLEKDGVKIEKQGQKTVITLQGEIIFTAENGASTLWSDGYGNEASKINLLCNDDTREVVKEIPDSKETLANGDIKHEIGGCAVAPHIKLVTVEPASGRSFNWTGNRTLAAYQSDDPRLSEKILSFRVYKRLRDKYRWDNNWQSLLRLLDYVEKIEFNEQAFAGLGGHMRASIVSQMNSSLGESLSLIEQAIADKDATQVRQWLDDTGVNNPLYQSLLWFGMADHLDLGISGTPGFVLIGALNIKGVMAVESPHAVEYLLTRVTALMDGNIPQQLAANASAEDKMAASDMAMGEGFAPTLIGVGAQKLAQMAEAASIIGAGADEKCESGQFIASTVYRDMVGALEIQRDRRTKIFIAADNTQSAEIRLIRDSEDCVSSALVDAAAAVNGDSALAECSGYVSGASDLVEERCRNLLKKFPSPPKENQNSNEEQSQSEEQAEQVVSVTVALPSSAELLQCARNMFAIEVSAADLGVEAQDLMAEIPAYIEKAAEQSFSHWQAVFNGSAESCDIDALYTEAVDFKDRLSEFSSSSVDILGKLTASANQAQIDYLADPDNLQKQALFLRVRAAQKLVSGGVLQENLLSETALTESQNNALNTRFVALEADAFSQAEQAFAQSGDSLEINRRFERYRCIRSQRVLIDNSDQYENEKSQLDSQIQQWVESQFIAEQSDSLQAYVSLREAAPDYSQLLQPPTSPRVFERLLFKSLNGSNREMAAQLAQQQMQYNGDAGNTIQRQSILEWSKLVDDIVEKNEAENEAQDETLASDQNAEQDQTNPYALVQGQLSVATTGNVEDLVGEHDPLRALERLSAEFGSDSGDWLYQQQQNVEQAIGGVFKQVHGILDFLSPSQDSSYLSPVPRQRGDAQAQLAYQHAKYNTVDFASSDASAALKLVHQLTGELSDPEGQEVSAYRRQVGMELAWFITREAALSAPVRLQTSALSDDISADIWQPQNLLGLVMQLGNSPGSPGEKGASLLSALMQGLQLPSHPITDLGVGVTRASIDAIAPLIAQRSLATPIDELMVTALDNFSEQVTGSYSLYSNKPDDFWMGLSAHVLKLGLTVYKNEGAVENAVFDSVFELGAKTLDRPEFIVAISSIPDAGARQFVYASKSLLVGSLRDTMGYMQGDNADPWAIAIARTASHSVYDAILLHAGDQPLFLFGRDINDWSLDFAKTQISQMDFENSDPNQLLASMLAGEGVPSLTCLFNQYMPGIELPPELVMTPLIAAAELLPYQQALSSGDAQGSAEALINAAAGMTNLWTRPSGLQGCEAPAGAVAGAANDSALGAVVRSLSTVETDVDLVGVTLVNGVRAVETLNGGDDALADAMEILWQGPEDNEAPVGLADVIAGNADYLAFSVAAPGMSAQVYKALSRKLSADPTTKRLLELLEGNCQSGTAAGSGQLLLLAPDVCRDRITNILLAVLEEVRLGMVNIAERRMPLDAGGRAYHISHAMDASWDWSFLATAPVKVDGDWLVPDLEKPMPDFSGADPVVIALGLPDHVAVIDIARWLVGKLASLPPVPEYTNPGESVLAHSPLGEESIGGAGFSGFSGGLINTIDALDNGQHSLLLVGNLEFPLIGAASAQVMYNRVESGSGQKTSEYPDSDQYVRIRAGAGFPETEFIGSMFGSGSDSLGSQGTNMIAQIAQGNMELDARIGPNHNDFSFYTDLQIAGGFEVASAYFKGNVLSLDPNDANFMLGNLCLAKSESIPMHMLGLAAFGPQLRTQGEISLLRDRQSFALSQSQGFQLNVVGLIDLQLSGELGAIAQHSGGFSAEQMPGPEFSLCQQISLRGNFFGVALEENARVNIAPGPNGLKVWQEINLGSNKKIVWFYITDDAVYTQAIESDLLSLAADVLQGRVSDSFPSRRDWVSKFPIDTVTGILGVPQRIRASDWGEWQVPSTPFGGACPDAYNCAVVGLNR